MIKPTPSFARVKPLCRSRKWQSWEGYAIADTYGFHVAPEYLAIRKHAALFDFFPLNIIYISGPDAANLLDRVVTRSMAKCRLNQVMYTALCDQDGKLIDDGTVIRLSEDTYQLSTNTPLIDWLQAHASGLNVCFQDKTLEVNTLQLQGPKSREILNSISSESVDNLKYFQSMTSTLRGIEVMITRTGFTGDLGYEVWSDSADAVDVWDILIEAGAPFGILPAGFTALDLVRIEAGLLWYEFDFMPSRLAAFEEDKCSPFEVGLEWVVDLSKPDFVGRDALIKERNAGVRRTFVGLELDAAALESAFPSSQEDEFDVNGLILQDLRNPWRTPTPIEACLSGEVVGKATAGCWSPVCRAYVAMACVNSAAIKVARQNGGLTLSIEGRSIPVKIRELPFYEPEHKRALFT